VGGLFSGCSGEARLFIHTMILACKWAPLVVVGLAHYLLGWHFKTMGAHGGPFLCAI
jgi:hypothetical protein